MITFTIPFDSFESTVNVPLEDILHYCGVSYHIGWLAGMGYVATSVHGYVCRRGERTPTVPSAPVAEGDSYEFVYDVDKCEGINLSDVSANLETSSSSTLDNARQDTAVVSNRDTRCVFSGLDADSYLCAAHIIPVKVQIKLKERLGLHRTGQMANLLRVATVARTALNRRQAAILATDDRFVPLHHMRTLQVVERGPYATLRQSLSPDVPTRTGNAAEPVFGLYYQFTVMRDAGGNQVRNDSQFVLHGGPVDIEHQCPARFAPAAFNDPDDAPAREALHYMYWGTMLLLYLDSTSRSILETRFPDLPPSPGPQLDGGDDLTGDTSGPTRNPGESSARSDFRSRADRWGKDKVDDMALSASEEILDTVLAMNRCALLPVLRAEAAREKEENDHAVRTWQASLV